MSDKDDYILGASPQRFAELVIEAEELKRKSDQSKDHSKEGAADNADLHAEAEQSQGTEEDREYELQPPAGNRAEDNLYTVKALVEASAQAPRKSVSPRPMMLDSPQPKNYELTVVSDIPLFAATLKRPQGKYTATIGNAHTSITPSILGRPADQERLFMMFVTSQVVQAQIDQRHENFWVAFRPADYFTWRQVSKGGSKYKPLKETIECLGSTMYQTNIRLTESYQELLSDDDREKYGRLGNQRTSGLVVEFDEETGQPTTPGTVDAGSFRLIEKYWWLGDKLIEGEVESKLRDYVLLKIPIEVFFQLRNRMSRLKAHDDIQTIKSAQVRALTQYARSYCGTQKVVRMRNEAAIYALLQISENPYSPDFDLATCRKNLRKLCGTQPLLGYAMWYGKRPQRKRASVSAQNDEWMFYFIYDPDGVYRERWANVKNGRRDAIPSDLINLYKDAIED